MKTLRIQTLVLLAATSLFVPGGRADEAAYGKILKERDTVLSQIVAARESRLRSGAGDEAAITSARLVLYAFRRDTAASRAEKLRQQELIVAVWQKELASVKVRATTGIAGPEDVLQVTDSLLQARQVFEELQRDVK
ncbi:MAG: hypothetical protein JNN01_23450 [Opitutaceae bacterium]|nr:hypothetical protein [Opitutaceae bacterium]